MKNTKQKYGIVSIAFHWMSVLAVFGLFGLGYWMVDLDYYHTWYKQGPDLHKSIGIVFLIFMLMRALWRIFQLQPEPLNSHSATERKLGHYMHILLYIVIFSIMISGYLISTADGRAIGVFQLFEIASVGEFIEDQEDVAGLYHQYAAYTLIFMVLLHAFAALKHHFIDKDKTLRRMFGAQ